MELRKFGIEIRKMGSLTNLYKDVDRVLSNSNIPPGGVSCDVQVSSIGHVLHKMMQPDAMFYVCDVRKCAEIAGIHISKERLDIHSSIHCMKWSEMTPEFRQQIMAMVLDDFRPILNP